MRKLGGATPKIGDHFSYWTVLNEPYKEPAVYRNAFVCICRCVCGAEKVLRVDNIVRSGNHSCGCQKRPGHLTHGMSKSRLYSIWNQMIMRVSFKGATSYPNYGAKGIYVIPEWYTFEPFKTWALANGYAEHLTLDRKDFTGPYTPENCRWSTYAVQSRNKSTNYHVTAFGETRSLTDWALDSRCLVKYATLRQRIVVLKWLPEEAITTPSSPLSRVLRKNGLRITPTERVHTLTAFNCTQSIAGWSKDPRCVVSYSSLFNRANVLGWDVEKSLTTPARPHTRK